MDDAEGGKVCLVARRHRISESLLYNWRSARKAAAVTAGAPETVAFVPVGVIESPVSRGPEMLAPSTVDQDPALQLDALAAAGCVKIFEDRASGARADRAGLRSALDYVRNADVLIVWKLDRLGRSLPHLIETVTSLATRGVGFRSITEAIDTTTPGGRLVFHLFGALGQFERDLIQERTRAGLTAAAARGRKGGRKPVVTSKKLERAHAIIAKGLTVREAATRLKVGKTAHYAALRS